MPIEAGSHLGPYEILPALYAEEPLPDGSILAVSQNGKDIVRIPPSGAA